MKFDRTARLPLTRRAKVLAVAAALAIPCAAPLRAQTSESTGGRTRLQTQGANAAPQAQRWLEMDPEQFRALAEARSQLPLENVSVDLLAAALHHETNRRRKAEGLPELKPDAQARAAAEMHSKGMAQHGFLDHVNPHSPEIREMRDRIRLAGLSPEHASENVAMGFGWKYELGRDFYTDVEGGREVYRYTPGGPPIERHTYLSFAEDVVNQWMNSPTHRKNLLDAKPEYLGVVGIPRKLAEGMNEIYCTQIFLKRRVPDRE